MSTHANSSRERFLATIKEIRLCFELEVAEIQRDIKDLENHLEERHKYFSDLLDIQLTKPQALIAGSKHVEPEVNCTEDDDLSEEHLEEKFNECPESPALVSKLYNKEGLLDRSCPESPVLESSVRKERKPVLEVVEPSHICNRPMLSKTPEWPLGQSSKCSRNDNQRAVLPKNNAVIPESPQCEAPCYIKLPMQKRVLKKEVITPDFPTLYNSQPNENLSIKYDGIQKKLF